MKALLVMLVALAALSGCAGPASWLGIGCEWRALETIDPVGETGRDDICYLAWPKGDDGRLALAGRGDDADEISCSERDETRYTADDPLVIRPGQAGWVFAEFGDSPGVKIIVTTCERLDEWIANGGTAAELAKEMAR